MKKILLILSLVFLSGFYAVAQDNDDDGNGGERIRDKMREFIQKRLNLSKGESERFAPVFLRYFKEWRTTIRDNKKDHIMLQKKIAEVQLRYRDQFKEIVGEQRSNEVFVQQKVFITEIRNLQKKGDLPTRAPLRRNRSLLQ